MIFLGKFNVTEINVNVGGLDIAIFENQLAVVDAMFANQKKDGVSVAISINAEIIMLAQNDPEHLSILQQDCCIRYADGIGVVKAIKWKAGKTISRLPGCEIWVMLMEAAGQAAIPVYLVGASNKVIQETKEKLVNEYKTLIVGSQDGYFDDEAELINKIKESEAQIVTVAMGSPKQEDFIFKCRDAGVKAIFMGVGGTYDVYTGNVKRAPFIWQKMGVEWLYRLLSQPTRWRRQVNLLRFIWLYINNRL